MNALRLRIQPIVRIALVAMLALVLTPTLAHALSRAQAGHGHWVEVCTQHGMQRVALQGIDAVDAAADAAVDAEAAADADADAAQLQATDLLEHCCDCSLTGHELAPPSVHTPLVLSRGAAYLAALFLHAPRTLFAWRGPQSRAPPLTA